MTARDVPRFVGDNSDNLSSMSTLNQKPRVYEEFLPPHNERVRASVIDQIDLNRRRIEPSRLEYWRCERPNGIFDFGITNKRALFCRRVSGLEDDGGKYEDGDEKGENAFDQNYDPFHSERCK